MDIEKTVLELKNRLENVEMIVKKNSQILKDFKEFHQNILSKTMGNPMGYPSTEFFNSLNQREYGMINAQSQELISNNKLKRITNENENKNIQHSKFSKELQQISQKKLALKNMDQNLIKCINFIPEDKSKFKDYKRITIKLKENTKVDPDQFRNSQEQKDFISGQERNLESESTQYFKDKNKTKLEVLAQTQRIKRNSTSNFSFPKEINKVFSPDKKSNKSKKTIIIEDIDLDLTDKKCFKKNKFQTIEKLKLEEFSENFLKLPLQSLNLNKEGQNQNNDINNKEPSVVTKFVQQSNNNLKLPNAILAQTRNYNFASTNYYATQTYKSKNFYNNSGFQYLFSNHKEFKFELMDNKFFNIIVEYLGNEYISLLKLNKTIRISISNILLERWKEKINILINSKSPINEFYKLNILNVFKDQEINVNHFKFSSGLIESINKLDCKLSLDILKVKLNEHDSLVFNCFKQVGKCCLFKFDLQILRSTELKTTIVKFPKKLVFQEKLYICLSKLFDTNQKKMMYSDSILIEITKKILKEVYDLLKQILEERITKSRIKYENLIKTYQPILEKKNERSNI